MPGLPTAHLRCLYRHHLLDMSISRCWRRLGCMSCLRMEYGEWCVLIHRCRGPMSKQAIRTCIRLSIFQCHSASQLLHLIFIIHEAICKSLLCKGATALILIILGVWANWQFSPWSLGMSDCHSEHNHFRGTMVVPYVCTGRMGRQKHRTRETSGVSHSTPVSARPPTEPHPGRNISLLTLEWFSLES